MLSFDLVAADVGGDLAYAMPYGRRMRSPSSSPAPTRKDSAPARKTGQSIQTRIRLRCWFGVSRLVAWVRLVGLEEIGAKPEAYRSGGTRLAAGSFP